MKKILNIASIVFGGFMLVNASIVFYRYSTNQVWQLSASEKLVSAIVTAIVGLLLLLQTFRIIKKGKRRIDAA